MLIGELKWLAGYLEGEGYFVVYRQKGRKHPQCHIGVHSTDRDVIQKVARLIGGKVYGPYAPSRTNFVGSKPRHVTQVYGTKAQRLAKQLLSYMGKRRAAKIRHLLSIKVATFPNLARDPATGRTVAV